MKVNTSKRFILYMHTAPNNKRYIGITTQKFQYRCGKGGKKYCANTYFWRAIQKYGWDNFKHEILFENLTYEDACKLEQQLIAQYKTTDERFGYNLSSGGELSAIGSKRTDVQRQRYSESKKGVKNPQYNKPSWNRGIPCREETREKLRKANRGNSSPNKGKHLSEEQKRHLHEINIGKVYVTHEELGVTKCIELSELDTYLQLGYHRGYSKTRKGMSRRKEKRNDT